LYAAAVSSFTSCNPFAERLEQNRGIARRESSPSSWWTRILSDETLADVDKHCPLIALPSDVARAGLQPRAAYTQLVESMLEIFRAVFRRATGKAIAKRRSSSTCV